MARADESRRNRGVGNPNAGECSKLEEPSAPALAYEPNVRCPAPDRPIVRSDDDNVGTNDRNTQHSVPALLRNSVGWNTATARISKRL